MKWRSRKDILNHQGVLILKDFCRFFLTVNYTAENTICLQSASPRQQSAIEYILTGTILLQVKGFLLLTFTFR